MPTSEKRVGLEADFTASQAARMAQNAKLRGIEFTQWIGAARAMKNDKGADSGPAIPSSILEAAEEIAEQRQRLVSAQKQERRAWRDFREIQTELLEIVHQRGSATTYELEQNTITPSDCAR